MLHRQKTNYGWYIYLLSHKIIPISKKIGEHMTKTGTGVGNTDSGME